MTGSIRSFSTTVMIAGLTAVLAAQGAPKMNVKMGLWEMTSTMSMSGDMPGVDMSKMTPEQQAQMKAAMSQMANKPETTKSCLTKEKFENGQMMSERQNCKQTLVANTASAYDVKVECAEKDGTTTNGRFHFEAPTSDTVHGTIETTSVSRGRTMNMKGTITGKWLGADCGAVK